MTKPNYKGHLTFFKGPRMAPTFERLLSAVNSAFWNTHIFKNEVSTQFGTKFCWHGCNHFTDELSVIYLIHVKMYKFSKSPEMALATFFQAGNVVSLNTSLGAVTFEPPSYKNWKRLRMMSLTSFSLTRNLQTKSLLVFVAQLMDP